MAQSLVAAVPTARSSARPGSTGSRDDPQDDGSAFEEEAATAVAPAADRAVAPAEDRQRAAGAHGGSVAMRRGANSGEARPEPATEKVGTSL